MSFPTFFIPEAVRRGSNRLGTWLATPAGAAVSFLVLMLIVIGRLWDDWDLAAADTAYYYHMAGFFMPEGKFGRPSHLVFSPLYVAFFAGVRFLFEDPHAAVIAQRYLSLLLAGTAVLLCARRVLPPPWSWLAAAWWMAVPDNSSPFSEVHVFSFAIFALGCWLAGANGGALARGCGLAIFVLVTLGLRNEMAPAAALFFLVAAIYEWRRPSPPEARPWLRWVQLTAPSLLIIALTIFLVRTRLDDGSWRDLPGAFQNRQRLNLAQVFAFGYQQRHPEWQKSPWTESGDLMTQVFGKPAPSVGEAWHIQPGALWEHMTWNLRLVPAGLQRALLGTHSSPHAPDFGLPGHASAPVLAASGCLLFIWASALAFRRRPSWTWLDEPRRWTWVALATGIPSSLVAIVTQRPRPSYIHSTTFLLLLLTVWIIAAWVTRWRRGKPLPPALHTGIVALALTLVATFTIHPDHGRKIRRDVTRLESHRRLIVGSAEKTLVFCTNRTWAKELTYYLSPPGKRVARSVLLSTILAQLDQGISLDTALEKERITSLYLTGDILTDPRLTPLISGTLPAWRTVGLSRDTKDPWLVIEHQPPPVQR